MNCVPLSAALLAICAGLCPAADAPHADAGSAAPRYEAESAASGAWSAPATWKDGRVPGGGDRVLVASGHRVIYDVASSEVIHSIRVAGALSFDPAADTELNVGAIRVQPGSGAEGSGVEDVHDRAMEGHGKMAMPEGGAEALLEVGAAGKPVAAGKTARIRLHFIEGMDPDSAPAIIARPGGRMEFHGAPMPRTWLKLGAHAKPGDSVLTLEAEPEGWREGDEIIVTGGPRGDDERPTEERRIAKIDGSRITLDRALENEHWGEGEFKSEAANLSRSVIVESADPGGVRGHTMYHWASAGSISYARFAHLGKKGALGRYPIHFHQAGDSMRGSSVIGAAVVDSGNRWVTIHGTHYLVVRDCIGYRSAGHGYFMEDATETYNLLDRNLAVQADDAERLPKQALPFDPNDGAGFWWANGKNTLTRNVVCENEHYGFRFDIKKSSAFDPALPVRQPDGSEKRVDVRTIPVWNFDQNEAHTEGLYGVVIAANGDSQPDAPIRDDGMLKRIRSIDWTGPDARHPHRISNLRIWEGHYAFRPHSPNMRMENVRIHHTEYGIYRPNFDNQEFVNLHLSDLGSEPFNRGMDDASAQEGKISVDGLIVEKMRNNAQAHPVVHMTDNNLSGEAECHFRRLEVRDCHPKRAIFNRGGSVRADPFVAKGVPYFLHDHFGPGRHALVASTRAADLYDEAKFQRDDPFTGDECAIAEIDADLEWPKLLDPVDDEPPATVILGATRQGDRVLVRGVAHDNESVAEVRVNGSLAVLSPAAKGVADWQIEIALPPNGEIAAKAKDAAGNAELTPHAGRWEF